MSKGFSPLKETQFIVKYKKNEKEWKINGESSRFNYIGTTKKYIQDEFFNHCLAIIDPETDIADLIPIPLIHLECYIKKQETLYENSNEKEYKDQKEALNKEFGSKRAKKAIRDKELHTIHTHQLNAISSVITKDIKEATKNLQTLKQTYTETHKNLPIPPPNTQTTNLEEVYSLSDIVSSDELSMIHIKHILQESNERARIAFLPFKNSRYINEHLTNTLASEKKNKHRVKLLYYMSLLMAFYTNRHLVSKNELISKKLGDPPQILIDNLIKRFSEPSRSGTNHETIQSIITSYGTDKILCYLFALCLIIDNFSVDINLLAQDLSLSIQKCRELFKTLGCKIQGCTETQRISMKLSKAEAKMYKKAVLTLPFEFVTKKQRRSK
ncbi:hypothetical protein PCANB_001701 [Pneumocystis canis]|nr:hypothetical protein PCANB_001701 [Pneumocystis canis]